MPPGVVNVVPGGREVGEHLVTHPGTDKVAFTGSTAAGKRIMSLCGEQVKRVSLELGGQVGLGPARRRRPGDRRSRGWWAQACTCRARCAAPTRGSSSPVRATPRRSRPRPPPPPRSPTATRTIPPSWSVRSSPSGSATASRGTSGSAVDAGARVVAGGERPAHLPTGWYVPPTILGDVDNSMRVAREEIFGPVLCFIPYDGDDDAVRIANDSQYGLSGGVWSADDARAARDRPPVAHRQRGRQRVLPAVPARAVRRVQAVGPRPRAGPRGPGRLPRAPQHRPPTVAGLTPSRPAPPPRPPDPARPTPTRGNGFRPPGQRTRQSVSTYRNPRLNLGPVEPHRLGTQLASGPGPGGSFSHGQRQRRASRPGTDLDPRQWVPSPTGRGNRFHMRNPRLNLGPVEPIASEPIASGSDPARTRHGRPGRACQPPGGS